MQPKDQHPDEEQVTQQAEESAHTESAERHEQELLAQRAETPEEAAELAKLIREIKREHQGTFPAPIRYLGLTLAGITFLALAALTIVLIQDVPFATRIYGPKVLTQGQRATFRIALFAPEQTKFLNHIKGKMWLVSKQGKTLLYQGKTDGKVLIANIHIPTLPQHNKAQKYHLLVQVAGPPGKETIKRLIKIVKQNNKLPYYSSESTPHHWDAPTQSPVPPYQYRLFAKGRALIADLPNTMLLQVQERLDPPTTPPTNKPTTPPHNPPKSRPNNQPASRPAVQVAPQPATQPAPKPATQTAPKSAAQAAPQPASRPTQAIAIQAKPKPANRPTSQPTPPKARQSATGHPRRDPPTSLSAKTPPSSSRHSARPLHRSKQLLEPFDAHEARPKARSKASTETTQWRTPTRPVLVTIYDGEHRLGPFTTDAHGIIRFPYMPQLFRADWKIDLRGALGEAHFQQQIKPEGYQVLLQLKRAIFSPGQPIPLRIDCLQHKGVFHIDLVQRGRRVWSTRIAFQGGKQRIEIKPPKDLKGLVSVQTYTEFYDPGEVYDARLLYIGPTPSPQALLKELEYQLSQRGDGLRVFQIDPFKQPLPQPHQINAWAQHLFAFAKARFVPPSLLYDSKIDRQKRLRQFKTSFRNQTLFSLGALGGFVLLGIFGWLSWGYRRDQIAIRLADHEIDDIEAIKTRGLPWLIGFFITLFLIFACIIYLFWAMKWTYDNL